MEYLGIKRITPDVAEIWLANNTDNRKVRRATVIQYAEDMSNGKWVPTHQGIALNRAGNVVDGQHRLLAIIRSGVTLDMPVFELDCESALVTPIDVGKKRSIQDITELGIKESGAAAFILKHIFGFVAFSPAMVVDMYKKISLFHEQLSKVSAKGVSSAAVRAATICLMAEGENAKAKYAWLVNTDFKNFTDGMASFYRQVQDKGSSNSSAAKLKFAMAYFALSKNGDDKKRIIVKVPGRYIDRARETFNCLKS